MSTQVLPISADKRFPRHIYDLDGRRYRFDYRYSQRADCWYFDLYDAQDVELVRGVKIVLGVPLLRKVASVDKPPGSLVAIDTSSTGTEPGLNDLGSRVLLTYTEA